MQTAHILSKDGSFMYRLWIMETFLTTAAMSPSMAGFTFYGKFEEKSFFVKDL